jgi:hypothetical protein
MSAKVQVDPSTADIVTHSAKPSQSSTNSLSQQDATSSSVFYRWDVSKAM